MQIGPQLGNQDPIDPRPDQPEGEEDAKDKKSKQSNRKAERAGFRASLESVGATLAGVMVLGLAGIGYHNWYKKDVCPVFSKEEMSKFNNPCHLLFRF